MAYFVWDEIPSRSTLLGMGMIIASGLYIGYRELRSTRRHIEPLPVAEAVVAPGNPVAPLSLGAEINETEEP